MQLRLLIFIFFSLSIFSCTDEDISAPVIEIQSLGDNTEYRVTDSITIAGRITDNEGIASIQLITDLNADIIDLEFEDPRDHLFEISFTPDPSTTPDNYDLVIKSRDISGNQSESIIQITIIE